MTYDVSVVIPAYNAANWIRTCVDSCLAQPGLKLEVIAVDDGSTDETARILREYENRITLIEQQNAGAGAARNTGIAASSGDYIKVVDADDYLFPGCLAPQLEHARSLGEREVSYGRFYCHDSETGLIYPLGKRDGRKNNHSDLCEVIAHPPPHQSVMWPKSVFDETGGYDNQIRAGQDRDFLLRVALCGWMFHPCSFPVYLYRQYTNAPRLSQNRHREDWISHVEFYTRAFEGLRYYPMPERRREVQIGLAQSAWSIGRMALRAGFPAEAGKMFDMARAMSQSNYLSGVAPYRILARLFGPHFAERTQAAARAVIRRP